MKVSELKPKQLYRIIIGENGNNPNAFIGVGIFKKYNEDTKEAIYEEAIRFKNGKPEVYKGFYKSILENDKFYPGLTIPSCADFSYYKEGIDKMYSMQKSESQHKEDVDMVNHPPHYTWLKEKCGIEVIDITRHLSNNCGNVVKYVLRHGRKSDEGMSNKDKAVQDLKKAMFYLKDEIKRIDPDATI
jgi:hypothetical protein